MRLKAAGLAASTLLLTAACVQESSGPEKSDDALVGSGSGSNCNIDRVVRVGATLSLTGGAAFAGEYQQQGLQLAIDELNQESGVSYELVVEDDETDVQSGLTAFEKLIERDEVSALIGPTLSNVAFSTYEESQDAGVPTIGISTTANGIPEIGDYIYRVSLPEEVALAESIPASYDALDYKDVAVMYDNEDEFTASAYESMMLELERLDVDLVSEETFPTDESDFRSQLTKVAETEPDVLVLSALPAATAPLVKQAREIGLDVPIVGGNAFNSPVMIDNLGDSAEGLIVGGAWSSSAMTTGNQEFMDSFEQTYDRAPDQFAAQAYTSAHVLDAAIRDNCDANRSAIREALGRIDAHETVLGPVTLAPHGEITQDAFVQIIKDGEFTPIGE
ncbi:ABC transporter substrate-binding protein [Haloglycomyces albus]|uniref:ABC transporter substrate-binding protein n=1 Tax=Haloglycomyces albus TaxID=526067 RepID=UPI00046CB1D6|nr:ABC transporter substrate-binding protein [Haloglycomyces albus]